MSFLEPMLICSIALIELRITNAEPLFFSLHIRNDDVDGKNQFSAHSRTCQTTPMCVCMYLFSVVHAKKEEKYNQQRTRITISTKTTKTF